MQIFICPKATPQAMPQAIFRKFRNFSKIAPGVALRLRPRANKNLHIPSGYASGVLLHHICPQVLMDTTVPFRLGYSQRVARDSVVVANSSWHQGVSNVASQTSDALSQSKRYSVAILTATVLRYLGNICKLGKFCSFPLVVTAVLLNVLV
ncbi:hypothetical protein T03_16910 [Trichinella britovi]|uniref:Uncharacterized protein n=1 Tax=Trichinella britovi TaxID=45882 RepID=A0A0V1D0W7_TRIBR|nr:hypothetical protein T03_16910 [Trichinella britovi]